MPAVHPSPLVYLPSRPFPSAVLVKRTMARNTIILAPRRCIIFREFLTTALAAQGKATSADMPIRYAMADGIYNQEQVGTKWKVELYATSNKLLNTK